MAGEHDEHEIENLIEADDYSDSGVEDESDSESYTTSLTSSITNYVYENGRRYHSYKEGNYAFPNDELESDRLDLIHHVFTIAFGGKLFFAPLKNAQRILDIGTGTGIWAIDVADEIPSAIVIGTDLSPIQPAWTPPNLQFEIDDAESEWTFRSNQFDLIHIRNMIGSIKDWPYLFSQCYKTMKPGGWFEAQECYFHPISDDDTLPEDSAFMRWQRLCTKASADAGRPFLIAHKLKGWFEDAGFVDIHEEIVKIPNNGWPKDQKLKELGRLQLAEILEGLQAISIALFTRVLGWTREEVEVFLVDVRADLKNRAFHTYYPMFVDPLNPLMKTCANQNPFGA